MFESLASCFAFRCSASLNMTVRLMSSSRVAGLCPELFACLSFANSAQAELNMTTSVWIYIALLFVCAGVEAQDKYRGRIVRRRI